MAKDSEWCAPFLWRSEFRNVLTTHMHHAGMSLEGARNRMAEAEKLLTGREYSVRSSVVLKLTEAHPISAYDAEFLCLAESLNINLVTIDKLLLGKFPKFALTPETFTATPKA